MFPAIAAKRFKLHSSSSGVLEFQYFETHDDYMESKTWRKYKTNRGLATGESTWTTLTVLFCGHMYEKLLHVLVFLTNETVYSPFTLLYNMQNSGIFWYSCKFGPQECVKHLIWKPEAQTTGHLRTLRHSSHDHNMGFSTGITSRRIHGTGIFTYLWLFFLW